MSEKFNWNDMFDKNDLEKNKDGCKYCAFHDGIRCSVGMETRCTKHHYSKEEFDAEVKRLNDISI
jgi:hypothetical protein